MTDKLRIDELTMTNEASVTLSLSKGEHVDR